MLITNTNDTNNTSHTASTTNTTDSTTSANTPAPPQLQAQALRPPAPPALRPPPSVGADRKHIQCDRLCDSIVDYVIV